MATPNIPVYLFTGFLEGGKTHIIQNSWDENFYYIGTVDEFKEWLNAFTYELEATAKRGEREKENENNPSAD